MGARSHGHDDRRAYLGSSLASPGIRQATGRYRSPSLAAQLAELTGHPIGHFAYPYGLWDTAALDHIKRAGFVAAFQLEEEMDADAPLFTICRMIVNSFWTDEAFQEAVEGHRE